MGLGKLVRKITRIVDPLDIVGKAADKVGGTAFGTLIREGPLGNADNIKELAGSKFGAVLSGRAILQGGAKTQNMESARTFDVFGSPATAGTKQQTTARAAAVIYGAVVAGGAIAAGSASSGTGVAGTSVAAGGSSGGAVISSGAAVSGATATTWGSTLASIGKYAALGLTLGRQFGVLPGPGNPEYAPETIPSENYLPGSLLDAMGGFPEGYGGPLGFGTESEEAGGSFLSGTTGMYIAAGVVLLLLAVFLMRRK